MHTKIVRPTRGKFDYKFNVVRFSRKFTFYYDALTLIKLDFNIKNRKITKHKM